MIFCSQTVFLECYFVDDLVIFCPERALRFAKCEYLTKETYGEVKLFVLNSFCYWEHVCQHRGGDILEISCFAQGSCYKSSWASPATKKVNRGSEHSIPVVAVVAPGVHPQPVVDAQPAFGLRARGRDRAQSG